MKKLLLTGAALLALTCGVFAQGWFQLDNSAANYANGVAIDTAGNYYTGNYGLEVWEINNTTSAAAINTAAALSGLTAYGMLTPAAGWNLEATYPGQSMTVVGAFTTIGTVKMNDVAPAGSTVTIALAAWNTTDASWAAMLGNVTAATRAGVVAFAQQTTDWHPNPTPGIPPSTTLSWGADLVMMPVPEPSTFALAGLGAAALLILRRRK